MQRHINKVASACLFHIRRLKQIRRLLGPEATATVISAFVLSRLDYCNAVLAGVPKFTIAPLQRAQNAAARLILRLAPHDHVTAAVRHLHWLPVQYRHNSDYLLISYPQVTILSQRHCHSDSISHFSWTTSVRLQSATFTGYLFNTGITRTVYLCTSFISTSHHPISKTLSLRQHQSVLVDDFGPPAVYATSSHG